MKKLMIACAIVAMAAASQAANWKWENGSSGLIYAMGKGQTATVGTSLSPVTAFIFTQGLEETVYDNWKAGKDLGYNKNYDVEHPEFGPENYKLNSKSVTAGKLAASGTNADFSDGVATGATGKYFVALVDDSGNLFISATKSGVGAESLGGTTLSFNFKAKSSATPFAAGAAYDGAGWYTAAVPEPTSGLLLLLGVAGLALRRRRA